MIISDKPLVDVALLRRSPEEDLVIDTPLTTLRTGGSDTQIFFVARQMVQIQIAGSDHLARSLNLV